MDEEMTLPRWFAISAQWRTSPPASRVMRDVADWLGIKYDAPAKAAAKGAEQDFGALAEMLGSTDGFKIGGP